MSYSVYELRPANPILSIGDRAFNISLITLHVESIIKNEIGELNKIQEIINKNPLIIFDLIWILLLNKNDFKDKKDFTKFIYAQAKTAEVSANIKAALDDSFIASMPRVRNRAKYDDMMKINNTVADSVPCYGVYYDRLAKRYGYTIDDFFNLTLGQLHILLNVSTEQTYSELEQQANIQGRKLKPMNKFDDLDEKVDAKLDDDAKELLERLKKEYKNG